MGSGRLEKNLEARGSGQDAGRECGSTYAGHYYSLHLNSSLKAIVEDLVL